jgi:hypothetical protein
VGVRKFSIPSEVLRRLFLPSKYRSTGAKTLDGTLD